MNNNELIIELETLIYALKEEIDFPKYMIIDIIEKLNNMVKKQ